MLDQWVLFFVVSACRLSSPSYKSTQTRSRRQLLPAPVTANAIKLPSQTRSPSIMPPTPAFNTVPAPLCPGERRIPNVVTPPLALPSMGPLKNFPVAVYDLNKVGGRRNGAENRTTTGRRRRRGRGRGRWFFRLYLNVSILVDLAL